MCESGECVYCDVYLYFACKIVPSSNAVDLCSYMLTEKAILRCSVIIVDLDLIRS